MRAWAQSMSVLSQHARPSRARAAAASSPSPSLSHSTQVQSLFSGSKASRYHAMAMLSEPPDHTRRMSELAALTNASLSRLSHLVKRMEKRGFIRREPDPTDGRYTNAILTPKGYKKLVASAPAHVEAVRSLVVDPLTRSELRQLRDLSERILARIDEKTAAR